MGGSVKVIVLRTAGTNCDGETAYAFRASGARVDLVHINRLLSKEVSLNDYHILAIPGGFTYGDDIISGRILANEIRYKLGKEVAQFIREKKLIIGICNGFQVLVRAGILPGPVDKDTDWTSSFKQNASLTYNDSGKFEDRWIHLKHSGKSIWTEGVDDPLYLPVAHAEGKFIPQDEELFRKMEENGQIIFRYCHPDGGEPVYPKNPNGSVGHIAGIADKTGRILGLMPHPERHFLAMHHPFWTRLKREGSMGQGAKIFENGVEYAEQTFIKQTVGA